MQDLGEFERSKYRVSNRCPFYIAWSDADLSVLNFFFCFSELVFRFGMPPNQGCEYLVSGWGCHLAASGTQLRFSLDTVTGTFV